MSESIVARVATHQEEEPGLVALVASDLRRYVEIRERRGERFSQARVIAETTLFKAGFHAALLHRVAHWLASRGLGWLAWAVVRLNLTLTGADIEYGARIGAGLLIVHPHGIVVGRGTELGAATTLFHGVTFGIRDWSPAKIKCYPRVGNGCFFFANASVLGDVRVGDGAVVGAHTLVLNDVPPDALAVGVPANIQAGRARALTSAWTG